MPILEVWGDYGCFTRPEMKVERVSYPLITPSAARGILEAIYWKPQFRWTVERIDLLSTPRYITIRRNEVKDRVPSARTIHRWMSGLEDPVPIYADGDRDLLGSDQKGRTQRQTVALKSPRYRLHARIEPWAQYQNDLPKFLAQFERRAKHGQCIYQPYLGCREFPAYFRWVESSMVNEPPAVDWSSDVGWMLFDVFRRDRVGNAFSEPQIQWFHCQAQHGEVVVPNVSDMAGDTQ